MSWVKNAMAGFKKRDRRRKERESAAAAAAALGQIKSKPLTKALLASVAKTEKQRAAKAMKEERLERKRAAYAPKREAKAQLKLQEALQLAKAEEETRRQIVQQALARGQEEGQPSKRQCKDAEISAEARKAQRQVQIEYYAGRQERFGFYDMDAAEEARQKKNAAERQKRLEKSRQKNFLALDTETTGFKHNQPLQVAVVRYDDGLAKEQFNQYYLPAVKVQSSAKKVHGLTKEELLRLGARDWTKGAC